jgi:hypothetical protein
MCGGFRSGQFALSDAVVGVGITIAHDPQIELFFKWIKQHLRIERFYGLSENAVKTQVWIAISVYVLLAVVKKHLRLEHSLYTLSQILSVSLFEKTQLVQVLTTFEQQTDESSSTNQFSLFNL